MNEYFEVYIIRPHRQHRYILMHIIHFLLPQRCQIRGSNGSPRDLQYLIEGALEYMQHAKNAYESTIYSI